MSKPLDSNQVPSEEEGFSQNSSEEEEKEKEKDGKKVITKEYEDGKLKIETNEDDFIKKVKVESSNIEIEAYPEDGCDIVTITKYYNDETVETFSYTFTPGNANYEDPWYLNDIWYYNDYLRETSIMPLINDIISYIKDAIDNVIKDED